MMKVISRPAIVLALAAAALAALAIHNQRYPSTTRHELMCADAI